TAEQIRAFHSAESEFLRGCRIGKLTLFMYESEEFDIPDAFEALFPQVSIGVLHISMFSQYSRAKWNRCVALKRALKPSKTGLIATDFILEDELLLEMADSIDEIMM
ncbi:hypothetical protein PFISCL1PPCAC_244, partial [Pristionchus fissidentatus]